MRSSLLFLLLFATQYCIFLSTCSAEAVTNERVDPTFPIPSDEELNSLSKEGLELELDKAEKRLEKEIERKNRTEIELETKRQELGRANESYIDAKKKWEDAKAKLDEAMKPLKDLEKERDTKFDRLLVLGTAVSAAEMKVTFPPQVENRTAYALNYTSHVKLTSENIEELKRRIIQLDMAQRNAGRFQEGNLTKFNRFMGTLKRLGCTVPDDLKKRPKRADDACEGAIEDARVASRALQNADKAFAAATLALGSAQDEVNSMEKVVSMNTLLKLYLQAIDNRNRAASSYDELKRQIANKTNEVSIGDAETMEQRTGTTMNDAKNNITLIKKEVARLERELKQSILTISNAEKVHEKYLSEYQKRTKTMEVEVTTTSSPPPYVAIGGPIGGVLLLLIIIAAIIVFLCRRRKKKRAQAKSSGLLSSRVEDIRIGGPVGQIILDVNTFKYSRIIQYDSYDGDLPHDKEKEDTSTLPKYYTFVKERMKFFMFGLEEDAPKPAIKRGTKASDLTRYFFQPHVFEKIEEKELLKFVEENYPIPPPQRFVDKIRAQKNDPLLFPKIELDPALMRREFLRYLHAMAAFQCVDRTAKVAHHHVDADEKPDFTFDERANTQRFKFEIFHIMWILTNVKQVLSEHHKSQLVQFNGSVVIVGDIHGQFPDLLRILAQRATEDKPGWLTHNYLFLGDYVDRGDYSLEVVMFLFLLKILYPKHFILLRGNHEEFVQNGDSFGIEIGARFGKCISKSDTLRDEREYEGPGRLIHKKINEVFEYMPIAALINNNIFCAHGGIGQRLMDVKYAGKTLADHFGEIPIPYTFPQGKKKHEQDLASETMWNDPGWGTEQYENNTSRDCCFKFGIDEYKAFKNMHGISLVFRGHQMEPNGFGFPFDSSFITTFSVPKYETEENRGATFDIDLNGKVGCQISGRDSNITNQEQAMKWFKYEYNKCEKEKHKDKRDESVKVVKK